MTGARCPVDIRSARAGRAGAWVVRKKSYRTAREEQVHAPFKTAVATAPAPAVATTPGKFMQSAQTRTGEMPTIDVRERLRAISEDDRSYPQTRIAKEAGVSSTTLSQFLSNTYQGNNAKVENTLLGWLRQYEERLATGGLPEGPAWVTTPTSEKIMAGLRYAQMANDMVIVYGGAGLGKTKTVQRYAASTPNVFHVEMSPATHGVLTSLESIAIAVGLRDFGRQAAGMHRAICARLRGTNGLLVVDEAQHLGLQALDQVRSIHDATGVGIALVGNERVYSQMVGTNRAAYLDRLYSRVGKKIHLKKTVDGDADALIKAWGIEDVSCVNRVRDIASKPGALRVLNKVLRLAATYAQAANRPVCCEDIHAACRELGGVD